MKALSFCILSVLLAACGQYTGDRYAGVKDDSVYTSLLQRMSGLGEDFDIPSAVKMLDSAFVLMERVEPVKKSFFLSYKAFLYATAGKTDSARYYNALAAEINRSRKPIDSAHAFELLAQYQIYLMESRVDSAMILAPQLYEYSDKYRPNQMMDVLNRLVNLYLQAGDTANIRQYIDRGLAMARAPIARSTFRTYLMVYLDQTGKSDSALAVFKDIITDSTGLDPFRKGVNYSNLADFFSRRGDIGAGIQAQEKGIAYFRSIGVFEPTPYGNMASLMLQNGDKRKAQSFLDSAVLFAQKLQMFGDAAQYSEQGADLMSAEGKNQAAADYLRQAISYYQQRDSANAAVKIQQVEIRLKNQQIENLAISRRAAEATAQRRAITVVALAGFLLLGTIITLLLLRRQRMAKALAQAQQEQKILRLQMEPHFIFNVLAQVITLIHNGLTEKAIAYLGRFSKLLRLVLVTTRRPSVRLVDEIEALEAYLYLQQVNLDGDFIYQIQVYDGYEEDEVSIPPMIIQPFVENAINHGVRRRSGGGGLVKIGIDRGAHSISCRIEDNGPGLVARQGNPEKESLSTQITRDRLVLLSRQTGTASSIHITDISADSKTGVLVELVIAATDSGAPQVIKAHAHHHSHIWQPPL
ncbi:tetratricopeptide repeat-containing sensor histidine kinase [Chitinophaga rhizosphaerae]|uniref:tetratricopeptide repeat-containing sensor histidine kinase n=1 Tax=Chitinophaga rhizosphaerae TaxID=1864947 RepID=UPI000F8068A7|nr:histidine kinase [Chitinophaga rhizosphaerae]